VYSHEKIGEVLFEYLSFLLQLHLNCFGFCFRAASCAIFSKRQAKQPVGCHGSFQTIPSRLQGLLGKILVSDAL